MIWRFNAIHTKISQYFVDIGLFKKFYEKYNEDIKYTCLKFDFNVECTYHDSTGRPRGDISFNLDFVYSFMERHIIDGFVYPGTDDERILFDPRIKKLK